MKTPKTPKVFWYIPGYAHSYLLAIKCTVVDYDEEFNNYWISEPIGHGISSNQMLTKRQAVLELQKRIKEYYGSAYKYKDAYDHKLSTLRKFRNSSARFILSTRRSYGDKRTIKQFLSDYPKEEEVEWFS